MRINWKRFIILLLILMVINYATTLILGSLGVGGIGILVAVCILSSFAMTILSIPPQYRKMAIKTPEFHKEFVTTALFLIILNLLLNFLF